MNPTPTLISTVRMKLKMTFRHLSDLMGLKMGGCCLDFLCSKQRFPVPSKRERPNNNRAVEPSVVKIARHL